MPYQVSFNGLHNNKISPHITQPLHERMAQNRRANSSGQDSAVHLHLKDKRNSFEHNNVKIFARERQIVWKMSKNIYQCQTGMTNFEKRRWPSTWLTTNLQCSTEFPTQWACMVWGKSAMCDNTVQYCDDDVTIQLMMAYVSFELFV